MNPFARYSEDPIAMSFADYHNWKVSGERYLHWESLQNYVNISDRELAKACKIHYRNVLTVKGLKNKLSAFQKELGRILVADCELEEQHVGIIRKLPYFYFEDLERERIAEHFHHSTPYPESLDLLEKTQLRRVGEVFKSRAHGEIQEYWFEEVQTGAPFLLGVNVKNELYSLVRNLINRDKIITVTGSVMAMPATQWIPFNYHRLRITDYH